MPVTQYELLRTGYVGDIWNARVRTSFKVTSGYVYAIAEPQYFGVISVRIDLNVWEAWQTKLRGFLKHRYIGEHPTLINETRGQYRGKTFSDERIRRDYTRCSSNKRRRYSPNYPVMDRGKLSYKTKMKREKECGKCACGCGQTLECKWDPNQKYIHGHNLRKYYFKSGEENINWNGKYGRIEEYRKKHSEIMREKHRTGEIKLSPSCWKSGSQHPDWKGGISFEPYSPIFNERLKEEIRTRDGRRCKICGAKGNGRKLDVHHVNYDKKDCGKENLITLCRAHNIKASKDEETWKLIIMALMKEIYPQNF